MSDTRYTALVLAATRGNRDPLAVHGGVSHKAFIDLAGKPMLRRVVEAVIGSGRVGRVIVSIEQAAMDEARQVLAGLDTRVPIDWIASQSSIGTSVSAATEAFPEALPLIITTGDNGLHTGEIVKSFCDQLDTVTADGALGLTDARYVLEKYPDGARAFHRFRDGAFSSCNLYALLTPKAAKGAAVFNGGGQFGKKPKRLIGAFGLLAFLVYKSRLMTVRGFLRVLSRGIKVPTAPVFLPFAEGPIDIDRMNDWELAEGILREREGSGA
jgi:GTP:adenosylcobinamide-phosphate guanylyltransferase